MANPWIAHVKKTMRHMKSKGTYAKGKGLAQVIKEAKKSWKSLRRGGADEPQDEPMPEPVSGEEGKEMEAGRRRRRGGAEEEMEAGRRHRRSAKKTRRHSRRR